MLNINLNLDRNTKHLLAFTVTAGGLAIICYKPEVKTEIIGLMTLVLSWYFGSSAGEEVKNKFFEKEKKEG